MTDEEMIREVVRAVLKEHPNSYQMRLGMQAWERCRQARMEAYIEELYQHYQAEMAGDRS